MVIATSVAGKMCPDRCRRKFPEPTFEEWRDGGRERVEGGRERKSGGREREKEWERREAGSMAAAHTEGSQSVLVFTTIKQPPQRIKEVRTRCR
jgi:hypothetical protein